MARTAKTVYQFKVALQDVKPIVWRRLQVPASYSFWDLHVAIQDSMGWTDTHLHEFRIKDPDTALEVRIGIPDDEPFLGDEPVLEGWEAPIAGYFSPANPAARYIYDFGDGWNHVVELEAILPKEPHVRYPLCRDGARKCPPEDVGGSPGYARFLLAIRNPRHREHDSCLEWVGGAFDPNEFDPKRVRFDSPSKRWRTAFEEPVETKATLTPKGKPKDAIPVAFTQSEVDLIRDHTPADPEYTDRLTQLRGDPGIYCARFTLADIDDLLGDIAAEANHCRSGKRRDILDALGDRLQQILDSHEEADE